MKSLFFPAKYYFKDEEDPSDPVTRFGRRKEKWGLRQRVGGVVDRKCEAVKAEYLGWKY
jgi:hypothetical protein